MAEDNVLSNVRIIFQFPAAGGIIMYVTNPPDDLMPPDVLDGQEATGVLTAEQTALLLKISLPISAEVVAALAQEQE
jgi:hypothetical protein